jgi:type II secretory ATPase GspE/PulE/Tfp pilus assembly ATPase PilB-like protein
VLAQRLVRVNCPDCRREMTADPAEVADIAPLNARLGPVWRGAGCGRCGGTGYRGRVGIYELLTMTDELRHAIAERRDASELRRLMTNGGAPTLRADGWRLIEAGVTTPEEVLRVGAR